MRMFCLEINHEGSQIKMMMIIFLHIMYRLLFISEVSFLFVLSSAFSQYIRCFIENKSLQSNPSTDSRL